MPSKMLVGQGIWGRSLPEADKILANKTPYFALKSVRIDKKNVYQVTIISMSLYTQSIGQVKRFC